MTSGTWHCEFAWLGGDTVARDVAVTSRDGVITSVQPGASAEPDAARLEGIVLPGFANVHSHAFHRALRGRAGGERGSFWTWRDAMYELAAILTPDTYRDLATAVFAEMLLAGFTTVGEFHYLHHDVDGSPYGDANEMSLALVDAADAAGVRLTLLDTCYLSAAPGTPPHGVQRRFADASADAWSERVERLTVRSERVVLGAAVHSVRAVGPQDAATVAAWAHDHGVPLHAHVSEQPRENSESIAAYGATPMAVLGAAGCLSPRFTAVHATHVTNADRLALGDVGATAGICPTTERDLADGCCELGELLERGAAVAVGTDSHASIDPFEELRCLEGHERLRTMARGTMAPASLLDAGTSASHHALGWDRVGRIEVGAECDLVCVSLGSVRLAGADPADLLGAVVAGASATDVTTVVRGGEAIVVEGRHKGIDVPRALARAISAVRQ